MKNMSNDYLAESFRANWKMFILTAGKYLIEKALWLHYAARQKGTPVWAKVVTLWALAYFIYPIDAIPGAIPIVPSGGALSVPAAIEVMRHSNAPVLDTTRANTSLSNYRVVWPPINATAPKIPQLTPEQALQRGGSERVLDELMHMSNKPSKPDRGPIFRDFNRAFNKEEQYQDEMWNWRMKAHEMRQKYNDPQGFRTR